MLISITLRWMSPRISVCPRPHFSTSVYNKDIFLFSLLPVTTWSSNTIMLLFFCSCLLLLLPSFALASSCFCTSSMLYFFFFFFFVLHLVATWCISILHLHFRSWLSGNLETTLTLIWSWRQCQLFFLFYIFLLVGLGLGLGEDEGVISTLGAGYIRICFGTCGFANVVRKPRLGLLAELCWVLVVIAISHADLKHTTSNVE